MQQIYKRWCHTTLSDHPKAKLVHNMPFTAYYEPNLYHYDTIVAHYGPFTHHYEAFVHHYGPFS